MAARKKTKKKTAKKVEDDDLDFEDDEDEGFTKDKIMKYFKGVIGLLVCLIGLYGTIIFWNPFMQLLKGMIGPFIILIGLIILLIAWTD